jgi:hypothetical protein
VGSRKAASLLSATINNGARVDDRLGCAITTKAAASAQFSEGVGDRSNGRFSGFRSEAALTAALEFNERSEPDLDLGRWLTERGVNLAHVLSIAGPLAEHPISLLPRGQFDFAEPLDHEQLVAIVHVALGEDAATPVDLIAWTRDKPNRMSLCLGASEALGLSFITLLHTLVRAHCRCAETRLSGSRLIAMASSFSTFKQSAHAFNAFHRT